jgi:hypothetical protein
MSYKSVCSSNIAWNTFLCMRLNQLRGPTPRLLGMDDSQGTKNVINARQLTTTDSLSLLKTKKGSRGTNIPLCLYITLINQI